MYKNLCESGFEIVFKPIVEHRGEVKGNVDAELVLYSAAVEFGNYDKAVIVTGDGDFHLVGIVPKFPNGTARRLGALRKKSAAALAPQPTVDDFDVLL